MPWTAQVYENDVYVSNGPAAGVLWGEQGSENEVYTKNERHDGVYSNSGGQIFTLGGFPVFSLFAIDSLWTKQGTPTQAWE